MTFSPHTPSRRQLYALFAFLFAVICNALLWGQLPGFNVLLTVSLYCVGFYLLARYTGHVQNWWALLFLIPVFALSAAMMLYSTNVIRAFAPFLIIIFLIIFSVTLTLKKESKPFTIFGMHFLRRFDRIFSHIAAVWRDLLRKEGTQSRQLLLRILLGVLIAIPFLLLFGSLFASADPVFKQVIDPLLRMNFFGQAIGRVMHVLFLTFLVGGVLYFLVSDEHLLHDHKPIAHPFDPVVTGVVLGLLNLLFLAFVAIQFRYLFGGGDAVLSGGGTYAEYARAGFFQLVWVMILAEAFLLLLYRSAAHGTMHVAVKVLKALLVILTGVVAFSALARMNLYQEAYGFTVLRLYVEWFIYLLVALLLLTLTTVIAGFSFRRYVHSGFLVVILWLSVVALLNVDAMIARENITRFASGKKIDIPYLSALSVDVYPVLKPFVDKHKPDLKQFELDAFDGLENQLVSSIARRNDWREWHRIYSYIK